MAQPLDIELAASATVTTGGDGVALDVGTLRRTLRLRAFVTAFVSVDAAPEPLVTLRLETRATVAAPWRLVDAVVMPGLGVYELAAGGLSRFVRVTWALTNMVSAEFEVRGISDVTYCDPADITTYAVPEHSIEEISGTARALACVAATDEADGYIGAAYQLPLLAWGDDLRAHVASIAAARIFRKRGVDPAGADKAVLDTRTEAITWLDRLANARITPPGIVDSTTEAIEGGSIVVSRPRRGW